jgi:hypothetical protein
LGHLSVNLSKVLLKQILTRKDVRIWTGFDGRKMKISTGYFIYSIQVKQILGICNQTS